MNKQLSRIALMLALPLSSIGMSAQQLSSKQTVVDLGQILYREPATAEFTLANNGRHMATIDRIATSCGCTDAVANTRTIVSKGSTTLHVTVDARQLGHFERQVMVTTKGDTEPLMLTVRGQVVAEKSEFGGSYPFTYGNLSIDADAIEFDDVNEGDRPVYRLHVKNNASHNLQPQLLHLPPYLQSIVSPSTLAPGRSGIITLTLDSHKLHSYGLTQTSIYLGEELGDKVQHGREISVSAVLLPPLEELTARQLAAAPRLILSQDSIVYDSRQAKTKVKELVLLTNTGQSELVISSIQMLTHGMQVRLPKSRLAAGETVKMRVTFEPDVLRKARTQPRILLITNDPRNQKVVVKVKAK